jgi:hypothetical protein
MIEVTNIDLLNKSYDEVNRYIHNLVGISETQNWDTLQERALRGIVPKTNDKLFFDIVENNHKLNNSNYQHNLISKYFRNATFMGQYFITGKNFYTYANKTKRLFVINVYEDYQHNKNIDLFKQLTTIFIAQQIRIYSIHKDHHDGHRGRNTPFKRNYIALMVVDV